MYFNINKFRYFFILFPGVASRTFEKLSHIGEVANVLLEKGDKPEMKVNVEMGWGRGGYYFFINLQFSHIYSVCGKSKVPFITFQFCSLLSQSCKIFTKIFMALKRCIIFIFLIHSSSLQKILTALYKLVWNTQKIFL